MLFNCSIIIIIIILPPNKISGRIRRRGKGHRGLGGGDTSPRAVIPRVPHGQRRVEVPVRRRWVRGVPAGVRRGLGHHRQGERHSDARD